jgi:N-acetylmuramoyl-L-alanine amidase
MSRYHTVRRGDCIHSIAVENGFFPDTLWEFPENAELKKLRKDPHQLMPGDRVFVPDLRRKEESGGTEATHRFLRKGVPKRIRVQVIDDGEPYANQTCCIEVDGRLDETSTDADGWIDHPIAPNAKRARVILASGLTFDLNLGHLDPIDDPTGVQQRLANLGLYDDPIDGGSSDATRTALIEFQRRAGLAESGQADQATQDKLVEINGG